MVFKSGKINCLPNRGVEELVTDFERKMKMDSNRLQQSIVKTNEKYDKKSIRTFVSRKYHAQELRVRLTQPQLQELKKLLDNNNQYTKLALTSSSILGRYKLNNRVLTLYKSGSIYSRKGLNLYKTDIITAITKYPTHPGKDIIIGQDEVGKGEYFGPMVVGSVALDQASIAELQLEGVRDSKKLDVAAINRLAEIIKAKALAKRAIEVGTIKFNTLYKDIKGEGKNLNDLLAWEHGRAFLEVENQLEKNNLHHRPTLLIIDQFDNIKTKERIESKLKPNIEFLQTPRGEYASIAVAAASILAKYIRNEKLKKIEDQYGYKLKNENISAIIKSEHAQEILRQSYVENSISRGTLTRKE